MPTEGGNQTKADQTKKGGAPGGEGQAVVTVPVAGVIEEAPATGAPEQSRKPAMKDWGEDDSDYDEDENEGAGGNVDQEGRRLEGPCEDDHVQVGSSHYKAVARDGQRGQKPAGSQAADRPPTDSVGDDLQFLNAEINQKNEADEIEGSETATNVGDRGYAEGRADPDGSDDARHETASTKRSSR